MQTKVLQINIYLDSVCVHEHTCKTYGKADVKDNYQI